jgi:Na+/H+ antiporter NhaD/arsenite permease-like protein
MNRPLLTVVAAALLLAAFSGAPGRALAATDAPPAGGIAAAAPAPDSDAAPASPGDAAATAAAAGEPHGEGHAASEPAPYWVAFFVLLLLSIAILPLVKEHWWESNLHKGYVAAALSVPVLVFYLVTDWHALAHSLLEYFSFIVLLWALFTVSGGIVLRGNLAATPRTNTIFLAVGAVIANIFGTTGAAMLLIRPLLATNAERKNKKHIVIFFIFLVANVGGCLTPLGDPPLFLGYLRGVPFTWTLGLWPEWLGTSLFLLALFYVWDRIQYRKEHPDDVQFDAAQRQPLRLEGSLNFLWIAGVLGATLLSKNWAELSQSWGLYAPGENTHSIWYGFLASGSPWRELVMITMGALSMVFTKRALRQANDFNFHAITEVAVLFAGIFVTMIPALQLLSAHGAEMGLTEPWQFMWATGLLSSFLDNAPTYLVFATAGSSFVGGGGEIARLVELGPELLVGISLGAVFMGANTYIGNAPNFMVKVIADTAGERRVKMPSFFGYMKWSAGILIPTYAVVTVIAFFLF